MGNRFLFFCMMCLCVAACATPETSNEQQVLVTSERSEDLSDCSEIDCASDVERVSEPSALPIRYQEVTSDKTYPPLQYGKPLPLVCQQGVPAEERLSQRPNLQLMWENYLYDSPRGVWAEVGGWVEYNGCLPESEGGWRNACTVRMSHMLNKAGHTIPYVKAQTVSGRDGDQYFYRLEDMQAYLIKLYGKPDLDIRDGKGRWEDLANMPGLILFKYPGFSFTGHATVWNGAGTVDDVPITADRILFWRLPCFLPASRKEIK